MESDAKVTELCRTAKSAIASQDWPTVSQACFDLEGEKGGAVWAHHYRGKMFEELNRFHESFIEYDASYKLGNHIAGGSAARVLKRISGS